MTNIKLQLPDDASYEEFEAALIKHIDQKNREAIMRAEMRRRFRRTKVRLLQ